MRTERGLERLVFFTDAVAAIAITLLVVPLVDSAIAFGHEGHSTSDFLRENSSALLAFLISFAVIARLWVVHHSLFERVATYTPALRTVTLLWVFTIAFLPLPTAMASEFATDRLTIALYIGTMTLSSVALTAIAIMIARQPALRAPGVDAGESRPSGALVTTGLFVVALVLGVATSSYLPLLVLLASGPIEALLHRRAPVG